MLPLFLNSSMIFFAASSASLKAELISSLSRAMSLDWLMTGKERFASRNGAEESAIFFNKEWVSTSHFEILDEDDKAAVEDYIDFLRYKKEHKRKYE